MGCPSTEIGMLVHYVGVYTCKDQCLFAVEKCGTNNVPSPSSIPFPPLTLECFPSLHFCSTLPALAQLEGLGAAAGRDTCPAKGS